MAGGTAVSAVELPASFDDTHLLSRFLGAGREREDERYPQEEPRQDRMTRQIQRGRFQIRVPSAMTASFVTTTMPSRM